MTSKKLGLFFQVSHKGTEVQRQSVIESLCACVPLPLCTCLKELGLFLQINQNSPAKYEIRDTNQNHEWTRINTFYWFVRRGFTRINMVFDSFVHFWTINRILLQSYEFLSELEMRNEWICLYLLHFTVVLLPFPFFLFPSLSCLLCSRLRCASPWLGVALRAKPAVSCILFI